MKAEGLTPTAIIETSPGNYQAWVKLSDKPLSADVRCIAAQGLAGFTNQKPQHACDGCQPYVLAHQQEQERERQAQRSRDWNGPDMSR